MNIRYILLQFPLFLWAKLKILTVVPVFSMLAYDLGGDKVTIDSLHEKPFDVHYVALKPSQLKKIQSSDLIVATNEFSSLLSNYSDNLLYLEPKALDSHTASCCHDHHGHDHHGHDHHGHDHHGHDHHGHDHHGHDHHGHDHHGHDHHSHDHDMLSHEWLSFQGLESLAKLLTKKLISIDPDHKEYYENRYKIFKKNFQIIKQDYTTRIPAGNKVFLHDSFFHLEKELDQSFGIILKKCHETSITPSSLQEIINSDKKYTALIAELPVDSQMIQKVAQKTNLKIIELDTLGYEMQSLDYEQSHSLEFLKSTLDVIYD